MDAWEMQPARDHGLSFLDRRRSVVREDGLVLTGIRCAWWWAVRCHLSLWNRLTIHRPENLPTQFPFVLVANHASHLDALVLTAALPWYLGPATCPLAAGDVFFESPFRGTLASALLNALPVWRRKHSGKSFQVFRERLLQGDCGYVLFPEGARSRDGRMLPFRSGVGMLVAGTNVPVIPCYLDGCFEALHPDSGELRRARIGLHVGAPRRFRDVPNDRTGWECVSQCLEQGVKSVRDPLRCEFASQQSRQ